MAISLFVCAHRASAQAYPPPANAQNYPQSYSAVPPNAPLQFQQPGGEFNFADTGPAVGFGPFTSEVQTSAWPQLYVSAESMFLWRDNHYEDSAPFDVGIGPRIFAGVRPDGDWELQAGYFGVFGMNSGNTYTDEFTSDVTTAALSSELNNVEVNMLRTFNEFAFLIGFRYLGLNDDFDAQTSTLGVPPDLFHAEYYTSIKNNLYGGQLGLRWRRNWERFTLEAIGKAGIFGNNALADGFVKFSDNGFGEYFAKFPTVAGRQTAFVGDLNFTGGFRLSPIWTARAGYNLLWINHVALAPDRAGFGNEAFAPVFIERRVVLHGANVGLEAVW